MSQNDKCHSLEIAQSENVCLICTRTCVFCVCVFFPLEPMLKHRKGGGVPLQSQSLGGRDRRFPWHLLSGKPSSRLVREPFSSKSRQCLPNGSKSCPLAYMHTKSSHTHKDKDCMFFLICSS